MISLSYSLPSLALFLLLAKLAVLAAGVTWAFHELLSPPNGVAPSKSR